MRARRPSSFRVLSNVESLESRLLLATDPPLNLRVISANPHNPNGEPAVYYEDTKLEWDAPGSGAPDTYKIYISDDNQTFVHRRDILGALTAYLDTNFPDGAGQRRYFRVTAFNVGEPESPPSNSVYPITAQDKSVQIEADVSQVDQGELTISWQGNPRFTSFAIASRHGGSGTWEPRDTVTGTSWTTPIKDKGT